MTARHHSLPNLTDFDLRLLRVFVAVAHNKGFAASQDELGITQSTISIQIRQLEERLKVRLCDRGRKGFNLTEEGLMVLEAAHSLFRAVDSFRGIMGNARGFLVGEVHFGTVDAIACNAQLGLEQAMREFSKLAPEVVIHIDISSPQELRQGLIEERYHAVLSPILSPHNSVQFVPAFIEQQGLFCGNKHTLFHQAETQITMESLQDCAYVGRSYMRDWIPPCGINFRHSAIASHMESIALLILSGELVGYLPKIFAAPWIEAGRMRLLLDEQLSYDESFSLGYRVQESNRAALAFIECLKKQLCH
ncbi:LysR family transcriptional regulator [Shewanella sp.]|uniref:LysR family transcriptional regulator n=1 Tax=Shewanella sp. TaxID=50422 RepID=UPI001EB22F2E|nr:LysR family transcriptional regulator [Shewanella sp.]NRB24235.1 LysR family transcriptional regulator [Shewanella sp.]